MQAEPSRVSGYWEGAKFRFDDYQAIHIAQTDFMHFSVRKSQREHVR